MAAVALNEEPLLLVNKKRALEFFLAPRFFKKVLNHESKHFEQSILLKAHDLSKGNFKVFELMQRHHKPFYIKNAGQIRLDEKALDRVEKIKKANESYPILDDYFEHYDKIKTSKGPKILKPVRELIAFIEKQSAIKKYTKAHDTNFTEIEAHKAEKNNGIVFR